MPEIDNKIQNITIHEENITVVISAGGTGGTSTAPHNLLSSIHPDTSIASPQAGDILRASGSPPLWRGYSKLEDGKVLKLQGGLPTWLDEAGGGGGGAPTDAAYVCIAQHATLTGERVLQGTANQVIITDGGANSNVTLSLPQSISTSNSPTFAGLSLTGLNGFIRAYSGALSAVNIAAADIPSLDTSKITTGTFADARIASSSVWHAKEPAITPGNTTQYWRGDKTWQTFSSAGLWTDAGTYIYPNNSSITRIYNAGELGIDGLSGTPVPSWGGGTSDKAFILFKGNMSAAVPNTSCGNYLNYRGYNFLRVQGTFDPSANVATGCTAPYHPACLGIEVHMTLATSRNADIHGVDSKVFMVGSYDGSAFLGRVEHRGTGNMTCGELYISDEGVGSNYRAIGLFIGNQMRTHAYDSTYADKRAYGIQVSNMSGTRKGYAAFSVYDAGSYGWAIGIDFRDAKVDIAMLLKPNSIISSINNAGNAHMNLFFLDSNDALVIGHGLGSGKLLLNINGTPRTLTIDGSNFVKVV